MGFSVFTDGTANLPQAMLDGITLLPCQYMVDGVPVTYRGDLDAFDVHAYYEGLRNGRVVRTTLLNTQLFLSRFAPVLEEGLDVIYVSMSSAISGTCNAARIAARELMVKYRSRLVHVVDSLGCGFGIGMLAMLAAELNRKGKKTEEAAKLVDAEVLRTCQYFTVDDLGFLRRTGRVSGVTARVGTMLNTKPILYGDSTGHIVSCRRVRGRRSSISALVEKYREKHLALAAPKVYISHGDCLDDAKLLAAGVRDVTPDADVAICPHEPFSGSHVGPGMLALFFRGTER